MARCKTCKGTFKKLNLAHRACSPECAIALIRAERTKAEKKQDAARRIALKSRSQLVREAQQAVNAYIRHRDRDLPCVSCGRWHEGQWHAGHYMSTGARPDLRFDEANIHKQCQPCNTHLSGNLISYRAELLRRIGENEVARLEGPASTVRMTRDDLIEIRTRYRKMTSDA